MKKRTYKAPDKKHPKPSSKQEDQVRGNLQQKEPKTKKEEEEMGPGKKDIVMCKECKSVYYYKSWHHGLDNYSELKKSKRLKFTLCPACEMIQGNKYEGEVIVENVPEDIKKDIKKLAENFGKRAQERDPLDRVISIEEKKVKRPTNRRRREADSRNQIKGQKDLRILTTENQLAQRLGEKINEAFGKKHKVSISHSNREDTTRVYLSFD